MLSEGGIGAQHVYSLREGRFSLEAVDETLFTASRRCFDALLGQGKL